METDHDLGMEPDHDTAVHHYDYYYYCYYYFLKAMCMDKNRGRSLIGAGGVASVSQLGLVHAAHQFLQLHGEHHVAFDLQLP